MKTDVYVVLTMMYHAGLSPPVKRYIHCQFCKTCQTNHYTDMVVQHKRTTNFQDMPGETVRLVSRDCSKHSALLFVLLN